MTWFLFILGAYLVGSIPFGLLIGRLRGIDIRTVGSKNIGATNVMRNLGKPLGSLCFGLDLAKGAGPVLAAGFACGVINQHPAAMDRRDLWLWLAVAIAPVLGHMFSIFLKFTGGKGVATGFGALAAMWPIMTLPALAAMVVWYAVLRLTRYVAVASMAAALSLPIGYLISVIPNDGQDALAIMLRASPPFIVTGVLALLIVYRHRGNIARLRLGQEPKVSGRGQRGGVPDGSDEHDA